MCKQQDKSGRPMVAANDKSFRATKTPIRVNKGLIFAKLNIEIIMKCPTIVANIRGNTSKQPNIFVAQIKFKIPFFDGKCPKISTKLQNTHVQLMCQPYPLRLKWLPGSSYTTNIVPWSSNELHLAKEPLQMDYANPCI